MRLNFLRKFIAIFYLSAQSENRTDFPQLKFIRARYKQFKPKIMLKTNYLTKGLVFCLILFSEGLFSQTLTMTELTDEQAYDAIGRYKETDEQIESVNLDANTTYEFVLYFNNTPIYRESLNKTTKSYNPSIRFEQNVGFCFKKNLLNSETILTLIENNIVNFGGKEKDYLCKTYFPIFKKNGSEYQINHLYSPIFTSKIFKVTYN